MHRQLATSMPLDAPVDPADDEVRPGRLHLKQFIRIARGSTAGAAPPGSDPNWP